MTPDHYRLPDGSDSMEIVARILTPDEFKGFLKGNVLKYLIRYEKKNGYEDLEKLEDYVHRLMDWEEDDEED